MKNLFFCFLLIILAIFFSYPLLQGALWKAHDSLLHVYRQASFSESLEQGNLVPRWGGNLNYGYGHPALMFHYPLNHYVGHIFHLLGASYANSVKFTFVLFYIASGVGMYFFLKRHVTYCWQSFSCAAIFLLLPYRMVLMYVRAPIGEHTALSFAPFLFLAFDLLMEKWTRKRFLFSVCSISATILLHQAAGLMVLGLLGVYILLSLVTKRKEKNSKTLLAHLALSFFFGICLAVFFWVPAIFEGKYTLRDIVMDPQSYLNRYPAPWELIYSPWGYGIGPENGVKSQFSVALGWISWLVIISGIYGIIRNHNARSVLAYTGLTGIVVGLFFLLPISGSVAVFIYPLLYFQFPWRLLSLVTLAVPFLAIVFVSYLSKRYIWIALFVLFVATLSINRPQGYYKNIPSDQELIGPSPLTTDTGESTPRWALRFQEHAPKSTLEVVYGADIDYTILRHDFEFHEYIVWAKVPTQVVDNTLYFPGWTVYVDGTKVPIIYEDQNWRGLITFPITEGEHQVKVVFEETTLRKIANAISLLTMGLLLGFLVTKRQEKHI